ncbi:MAG: YifB family Mg chelatase-like AAA ATPase [Alkalispirochaeta sp.]
MIYGFSPIGVIGRLVRVEVDIRRGLPGTDIVGLPSSEVREARERVRIAIRNSGFVYPAERILINLSPAEIPKVGAGFDLPIALAILNASEQIDLPEPFLAVGELSIRGDAIPVRGTLSAVLAGQEHSVGPVVIPERSLRFLSGIEIGAEVIRTIHDLKTLRTNGLAQAALPPGRVRPTGAAPSFDDMEGQRSIKWASTLAAAGFHNLLLMGPPGSGKTMAARRLVSLLPDLSSRATREVARIYSMRGIDGTHPGRRPPVRMPHHSASMEGVLGGGRNTLPGEVSLAHNGILILDEAPEFRPQVLQALREPVEARHITISRAGRGEDFPTRFQLVLTSNLCPCGKMGQEGEVCMCSAQEVARYWRRLGAALLDRVDLRVRSYYYRSKRSDGGYRFSMTQEEMKDRVAAAHARQRARGAKDGIVLNGLVPPEEINDRIPLSRNLIAFLQTRMHQLKLSDRAAASVRCVARTIADVEDREHIEATDILEAAKIRALGPDSLE